MDREAALQELRAVWKTDAELQSNLTRARQAAHGLGMFDALEERYGNDPLVIQLLAKTGAPGASGATGASDVEVLMRSEAYRVVSHPDHDRVSQAVVSHFASQPGADERID